MSIVRWLKSSLFRGPPASDMRTAVSDPELDKTVLADFDRDSAIGASADHRQSPVYNEEKWRPSPHVAGARPTNDITCHGGRRMSEDLWPYCMEKNRYKTHMLYSQRREKNRRRAQTVAETARRRAQREEKLEISVQRRNGKRATQRKASPSYKRHRRSAAPVG